MSISFTSSLINKRTTIAYFEGVSNFLDLNKQQSIEALITKQNPFRVRQSIFHKCELIFQNFKLHSMHAGKRAA